MLKTIKIAYLIISVEIGILYNSSSYLLRLSSIIFLCFALLYENSNFYK